MKLYVGAMEIQGKTFLQGLNYSMYCNILYFA